MHFTLKLLRPLEIVLEKKAGVKQFGKAYTHTYMQKPLNQNYMAASAFEKLGEAAQFLKGFIRHVENKWF